MDTSTLPNTISVEVAASLLGVSTDATYDAVRRGEIRSVRVGRRIRIATKPLLDQLGLDTPEPEIH